MPEIVKVKENIKKEIKTSILNEVIQDAYQLNIPPSYKGKRLKIYFTSQTGVKPPKFTFRVNNKGLVHFSYERYLENKDTHKYKAPRRFRALERDRMGNYIQIIGVYGCVSFLGTDYKKILRINMLYTFASVFIALY